MPKKVLGAFLGVLLGACQREAGPTYPTTNLEAFLGGRTLQLAKLGGVQAEAHFTTEQLLIAKTPSGVPSYAAAWVQCSTSVPHPINYYMPYLREREGDLSYLNHVVAHEVCHVIAEEWKCAREADEARADRCAEELLARE